MSLTIFLLKISTTKKRTLTWIHTPNQMVFRPPSRRSIPTTTRISESSRRPKSSSSRDYSNKRSSSSINNVRKKTKRPRITNLHCSDSSLGISPEKTRVKTRGRKDGSWTTRTRRLPRPSIFLPKTSWPTFLIQPRVISISKVDRSRQRPLPRPVPLKTSKTLKQLCIRFSTRLSAGWEPSQLQRPKIYRPTNNLKWRQQQLSTLQSMTLIKMKKSWSIWRTRK